MVFTNEVDGVNETNSALALLAVEGGGTRSAAGLYSREFELLGEATGGACNPIAYGPLACVETVAGLAEALAVESRGAWEVVLALAGAGGPANDAAIVSALFTRFPKLTRVRIGGDLMPIFHANAGDGAAMMAIAGTGSNIVARDAKGAMFGAGGRGTLMSDEGSAYAIAAAALRAAARARDGIARATQLDRGLTEAAGLNDFEDFVAWQGRASKAEVAALARAVVTLAENGDPAAATCVAEQADALAALATVTQSRAKLAAGAPLYLQGGMFREFATYRRVFEAALQDYGCTLTPCDLRIASHAAVAQFVRARTAPECVRSYERDDAGGALGPIGQMHDPRPTEGVYAGVPFDALSPTAMVERMCAAEGEAMAAVARAKDALAEGIDRAATALRAGGRLVYLGAGTSGRLGVLDASECPPTFGVAPGRVLGIMAGGDVALRESIEGAEDDTEAAARDVCAHGIDARDFVIGIASSGTTPYVLAALAEARARGAATALMCCNPAAKADVDLTIVLDTGPEVLSGSTRLKAGAAQKLSLNILSTGAMARTGRVYQGLMVHMQPSNTKLRGRAIRIIAAITGADAARAEQQLDAAGNDIATAILMELRGLEASAARAALDAVHGDLRAALQE